MSERLSTVPGGHTLLVAATAAALVAGALVAAGLGIRIPAALSQGWGLVVLLAISPILEEWLLRAGLHDTLMRRFPGAASGWRSPVTAGVALAFGALHALVQWNHLGVLTAAPAWLIGHCYARQRS
ncbi:MAG TPA: JDVT-CTERM system glutamic-type intramembrane protease, partial [Burkholderiaceae bacterium]|nr:JDVT-CTERM system glutamic-type intramembrane protease [Burkholderiaceae bacterium]